MYNSFTRIIKGGVYEKDNGEVTLVLSCNQMNSVSQFVLACKIVNEDEDDLFYHINYDTEYKGKKLPNKILLNCTYSVKAKLLKTYKYMLSDEIMKKVDIAFMQMIFGEQMYSLSEARNAIADHELALKVSLENNTEVIPTTSITIPNSTFATSTPTSPIIPTYINEKDIDNVQDYYAKKMMQEDKKFDNFNPVLPDDYIYHPIDDIPEVQEVKVENEIIEEVSIEDKKPKRKSKDNFTNCDLGISKGTVIITKKSRKKESAHKKKSEIKTIIKKNDSEYLDIDEGNNYIYFLEFYYKKQYDKIKEIFGVDTDMKTLYNISYKCRSKAKANLESELIEQIKKEAREELYNNK